MKGLRYLGIGLLALLAAAFVASACGEDEDEGDGEPAVGGITVEDAWARTSPTSDGGMDGMNGMDGGMTPMAGQRGAAYMIIKNAGEEDDALAGASSDVSSITEIHESVMDGDKMTMQKVDKVDVPAGGQVELKPGGYHLMFMNLKEPLETGTTITITLEFEKAGEVEVEAEVREQ